VELDTRVEDEERDDRGLPSADDCRSAGGWFNDSPSSGTCSLEPVSRGELSNLAFGSVESRK